MSKPRTLPIFCDNCNALALAELDNAPMCIQCLMEELGANKDAAYTFTEIRPLHVSYPEAYQNHISLEREDATDSSENSSVA